MIFKAWVGSTTFFETISIATILIPFIVPTIFNIMSGIYATQGNLALAGKYTSVNYYCWAVFAFVLAILIMFAGLRLIALLNDHLSSQLNRHNNMAKIKTGALKVSARANRQIKKNSTYFSLLLDQDHHVGWMRYTALPGYHCLSLCSSSLLHHSSSSLLDHLGYHCQLYWSGRLHCDLSCCFTQVSRLPTYLIIR